MAGATASGSASIVRTFPPVVNQPSNTAATTVPRGGTAVSAVNVLPFPCSSGAPRSVSAQTVSLRTVVLRKSNEQGASPGKNTVETTVPRGTAVSAVNPLPFPCSSGAPRSVSAQGGIHRTVVPRKSNEQGTSQEENTVETTVPRATAVSAVNVLPFPCSAGVPSDVSAQGGVHRTIVPRKSNEQGTSQEENTVETTVPRGTAVSAVNVFPFPCSSGAPGSDSAQTVSLRTVVPRKSHEQGASPGKNTVETTVARGTAVSAVNRLPFPCSAGAPRDVSAHMVSLRTVVLRKSNEQGTSPGKNTVGTTVPRGTAVSAVDVLPFPCSSGAPRDVSAQMVSLRTVVPRKSNEQGTSPGENTVETTVARGTAVPAVNVLPFPCSAGAPRDVSAQTVSLRTVVPRKSHEQGTSRNPAMSEGPVARGR